jgi:NAD(P)H-dependent FMN reductase
MAHLTIISCTNRPESRSLAVANIYASLSKDTWTSVSVHSLEELNGMTIEASMYGAEHQDEKIKRFQDEVILPGNHFLFVIPEYNGTFSGILKFLIDAVSIRDKDKSFKGKNVAMIGVASGRSGNLRGMDHLTNALNYLGMNTFQSKILVSQIHKVLSPEGTMDEATMDLFKSHSMQYLDYCS